MKVSLAALRRWLVGGLGRESRFLARIYRGHWRVVSVAFFLNLLAALFETSTIGILVLALQTLLGETAAPGADLPVIGPWLAARYAGVGRDGTFLLLVGLAVAAQLAVSALDFGSRAANSTLQARVEGDLRNRIFRRLMSLDFARVMRHKVGDLAAYNEQVGYVGLVIKLHHLILSQLVMMAAYIAILFWLSWPMTLAALVAVAVLAATLRQVVLRIRALGKRFTRASVSVSARVVEFLSGLRLIRTFAREEHAIARVGEAVEQSVRYRRRGLVWNAAIGPLGDSLTILGVAVFLVSGHLLLGGAAGGALPRLIAFLFVLHRMLPRIKLINDRAGQIGGYWEFLRRVCELLEKRPEESPAAAGRPIAALERGVEFRDVSLVYDGESRPALDRLSFTLPRTGMVALVGESGAGKTTVADLLLGLYRPTGGAILVDGVDLTQIDWRSWRERLGVVSQESFLLHATVRDNIRFGRLDASDEEVEAAARTAHAHEFVAGLPAGYDSVVGDQGYRLSGGQRQRLSIARAIVRDPDVLVLDEATSQLDSESERLIQEAIRELRRDRAILVIAHRLSTLVQADEIVVLESGRLAESGSHDELLAAGGRYAAYWALQSTREPRSAPVAQHDGAP